MTYPFIEPSVPEGRAPNLLASNDLGPAPSVPEAQAIVNLILTSAPDIYLFKHYHWLTGRAVPPRKNLQTNADYVRKHFWRLRRAAELYRFPDSP